jgi:hypothetical protein
LDVLTLTDDRTQLALRGGSAFFDVGALDSDELYEVATPRGAVDFTEPGLYQIGMEDGNVIVSVLSGLAQVVGQEGSDEISAGEVITLGSSVAAQAVASKLAPALGGEIVDDYYRSRYPTTYDGRYRNYDSYLSDPDYYDPYRSSASCRYVPADVAGLYDLDSYGDWTNVSGYGNCWSPRVGSGWAPFREGFWNIDGPWGPTWVSNEPWGWAPYHYGRWTFVEQRWFWVPSDVVRRPAYCAAPVAFIPLTQTAQIAWVPLAPGEPFVQRYYDRNFQPRYLASNQLIREERQRRHFANFDVPSGLTVVPLQSMTRLVDSRTLVQVNREVIARSQPVLDPFSVDEVRQIALRRQERRQRIRLDREEQQSLNQKVIASARPAILPTRGDLTRSVLVDQLPEARKKDKMKIGETGQVVSSRGREGLPEIDSKFNSGGNNANEPDRRVTALAERANQGDKSARRELRQLRRETGQSGTNQPSVQQEQLRQQLKQQKRLERQKVSSGGQQEAARQTQTQQVEARQKEKQLRRSQQEAAGQQQSQAEQLKQEQRKQVKQESRMQRTQQDATRQNQQQNQQQMRQQQKQQKRQERKPPQTAVAPIQRRQELSQQQVQAQQTAAAQQRQQLKAQRHEQQRAMSEQSKSAAMRAAQAQQASNAQTREMLKQQRRMERVQSVPPPPSAAQSVPAQPQRKAEKARRKNDGN